MKKIKLGDVLDVRRGASLAGEYYSEQGNLIRLTLGNFNYPRGGFQDNTSKKNIYFVGSVNPAFILKAGDIITPLTEQVSGLLGETATIPESDKYVQSGDIGLVIPDETKIDKRFAYYLVSSPVVRKQLDAAAQQTKIRHTSPDAIKACEAWIPENISTQRSIGKLLDALDEKIALNKKINATLEAIAKTLYDYWFVQFDFPDENGKPYKTSGGKMIYSSELGRDISAGWEVGTLENFGTLKNGINYDKNTIGDCRVKIVNVKDISNSTFSIATESLDDINLPEEQTRKYLTTTKDILIARSGIPGAVRTLADENFHSIYCGFIICFQPQNKLWKNFMTFTLQKHYEIISTQSAGTIMQNITQDTLKNFRLIVPPLSVLEKFNRVVEPMIFKINKNILESRRLAALRDWLLPMLMNGQIDFKEKI